MTTTVAHYVKRFTAVLSVVICVIVCWLLYALCFHLDVTVVSVPGRLAPGLGKFVEMPATDAKTSQYLSRYHCPDRHC